MKELQSLIAGQIPIYYNPTRLLLTSKMALYLHLCIWFMFVFMATFSQPSQWICLVSPNLLLLVVLHCVLVSLWISSLGLEVLPYLLSPANCLISSFITWCFHAVHKRFSLHNIDILFSLSLHFSVYTLFLPPLHCLLVCTVISLAIFFGTSEPTWELAPAIRTFRV